MRIAWKINSRGGFSLVELLVATLILLMVSSVVAGGIPVARDAYNKVTVSANAQVLLSTAITSLRNELGTASDVSVDTSDDTTITYTSAKTGAIAKIYLGAEDEEGPDVIMVQDYTAYSTDDSSAGDGERQLVSSAAATDDLYVIYESVAYDEEDGVVTFTGLEVKQDGDTASDQARAELENLYIRVIRES